MNSILQLLMLIRILITLWYLQTLLNDRYIDVFAENTMYALISMCFPRIYHKKKPSGLFRGYAHPNNSVNVINILSLMCFSGIYDGTKYIFCLQT